MTPTQENELRELDCWIDCALFGCTNPKINGIKGHVWQVPARVDADSIHATVRDANGKERFAKHYTTDPAAAMAVLEKCLLHVKARQDLGSIVFINGVTAPWIITTVIGHAAITEGAETLPLAICRFAKAMFAGKDL